MMGTPFSLCILPIPRSHHQFLTCCHAFQCNFSFSSSWPQSYTAAVFFYISPQTYHDLFFHSPPPSFPKDCPAAFFPQKHDTQSHTKLTPYRFLHVCKEAKQVLWLIYAILYIYADICCFGVGTRPVVILRAWLCAANYVFSVFTLSD